MIERKQLNLALDSKEGSLLCSEHSTFMVILENSVLSNICGINLLLVGVFSLLKIQCSPSIAKLPEVENKKLMKGLLARSDII